MGGFYFLALPVCSSRMVFPCYLLVEELAEIELTADWWIAGERGV